MTDMMVDVETTGTCPSTAAIIQLSAIKFNYDTGEIGQTFDRCPAWLPKRYWDEGTREFWMKHQDVYDGIVARTEPAGPVFHDFTAFCLNDAPYGGFRFWAKPTTFDWSMVADHYLQIGFPMPFHFRIARDLNSFIAGLRGLGAEHVDMDMVVPFRGDKHNGLHDCAHQIDVLFAAKRGNFAEVLPPE